jgi:iron complex transport system substrate-binding protein
MKRPVLERFARSAALVTASLLAISACGSDSKSATTTAAVTTAVATTAPATTAAPATTDAGGTDSSVPTSVDIAPVDTSSASSAVDTTTVDSTEGSSVDGTCIYCVETADGVVSLKAKPVKIVSLAATHTESLFAIGAGPQVIAVDDQSNFPAEAAAVKTDLSGYTPNIEAIAGYKPDLVVLSGDTTDHIAAQLQALDIPVWIGAAPTSLDDVYSEIQQLGTLTGNGDAASVLVTDMQADIATILEDVPDSEVPVTYYHELDNTYYSVTSNTFIGQIYSLANLQNIADGTEAGNDYPQLNSEFIISADPQLIFLADTKCCGESAETVAARDGWADIAAVKNGGVIEMDDDIASRWGPRVVDYLRAVVDAVTAALAVPAG